MSCARCGHPGAQWSEHLGETVCWGCYHATFPADEVREAERIGRQREAEHRLQGAYSTPLSAIERERVQWLWPGLIPLGMLTLLIGDPGLGKSVMSLYLASLVSQGGGDVLILSAEDHAGATIRPRAEAVGADLDRLHVVGVRRDGIEDGLALPDDAEALDRLAREKTARLVILDPLTAHLAEAVNSWRDQSVRRALAPLYRLAERQGCAVLVVAHLNKMRGADPLYRAGGSIGIPAAVRSALLLARDPDDPDGERGSQRVLAHIKCNVAEQAESLACRIEPVSINDTVSAPRLIITGTSKTSAADLLDAPTGFERTERDAAADFLVTELAQGPRPVREVRKAAREAGIADRTLDRAKLAVGVDAQRIGGAASAGHWEWSLSAPDLSTPPHIRQVALLANPAWRAGKRRIRVLRTPRVGIWRPWRPPSRRPRPRGCSASTWTTTGSGGDDRPTAHRPCRRRAAWGLAGDGAPLDPPR